MLSQTPILPQASPESLESKPIEKEKKDHIAAVSLPGITIAAQHIKRKSSGLWEYHFDKSEHATKFLEEVQKQLALKNLGIQKASVKQEKCQKETETCCVVKLTDVQCHMLSLIQKNSKITDDKKIIENLLSVARDGNSTNFQELIQQTDAEYINQALGYQSKAGDATVLIWAANRRNSGDLQALIAKASLEAIDQAFLVLDREGNYPLIIAAIMQDSVAFLALITKVSPKAINQTLALQNIRGDCALGWAATKHNSATFRYLIDKVSSQTIDQALISRDKSGQSALNYIVTKQDSLALQAVLTKASTAAIDQGLLFQNVHSESALNLAASHQNSDGFQALITKASPQVLDQALVLQDIHGNCALLIAAEHQSWQSMKLLLQRLISPVNVMNSYFKENPKKFFEILKKFSLYQSGENIILFLSLLDDDFLLEMAEKLPEQIQLGYTFQALLAFNLKTTAFLQSYEAEKEEKKSDRAMLALQSETSPILAEQEIETKSLASSDSEVVEEIKKPVLEEKKAEVNLKFLKQLGVWQKPAAEKVNRLRDETTGIEDIDHTEQEKKLVDCFKAGNAVVKIIRETGDESSAWYEFRAQLANYKIRPKIRNYNKPAKGFKYIHIPTDDKDEKAPSAIVDVPQGKIIAYDLKAQQAKKPHKVYTKTKATAATVISKELNTALFSIGQVGMVFDAEQCDFKMMLTRDRYTYARSWLRQSLEDVVKYANKIIFFSNADYEKHKKDIENQPYVLNESLVRVPREAVIGHVVHETKLDTFQALELALRRQKESQPPFNSDVPIAIYNSILQTVRIFKGKELFLHQQKAILKELSPIEAHHFIFLSAIDKLTGSTTERLQQLHFLISCYLNQSAHKAFLRNGSFYNTLQRSLENLNEYKDDSIQSISDESKEKVYQTLFNIANDTKIREKIRDKRAVKFMLYGTITMLILLATISGLLWLAVPTIILLGLLSIGVLSMISPVLWGFTRFSLPKTLTSEEIKKEYPDPRQSKPRKELELLNQDSKPPSEDKLDKGQLLENSKKRKDSDRDSQSTITPTPSSETRFDSVTTIDSQLNDQSSSDLNIDRSEKTLTSSSKLAQDTSLPMSSSLAVLGIYKPNLDPSSTPNEPLPHNNCSP